MNASRFLEFLRARPVLVVCVVALALAISLAQSCKTMRRGPNPEILATFAPATSNLHVRVTRKTPDLLPQASRVVPVPASTPAPTVLVIYTNLPNPMLTIHVPPDSNAPPSGPFLPTGRKLVCQSENFVFSGIAESPIIGFLTQNADWGHETVIPKDAEVHGFARTERVGNRIFSQARWVIVWPTGEELAVSGIAMMREYDPITRTWGAADATPGLAGTILTTTSLDEVKLFLATALSGFAIGMQQQSTTVLGIEHTPANARNAALAGLSKVLDTYAGQVLETIKKDGLCVVVPPTQFYVYVTEPVDLLKARIAGSRLVPVGAERPTAAAPNPPAPLSFALPPATTPTAPMVPRSR